MLAFYWKDQADDEDCEAKGNRKIITAFWSPVSLDIISGFTREEWHWEGNSHL